MTKRMLIDGSHPEETRVVVVADQHLEDFDFETTTKKQIKGNIYLAKVMRVEPSLQAAFVDYGGNRHGFLAFSEIHPDYFQIPQADRDLLNESRPTEPEPVDGNGAGEEVEAEAAEGGAEAVATDPDEETAEVIDEQQRRRSRLLRSYKIQEVIKRRQILLVQVVKEERGTKGAALTTYLSLAGRYCVLMPNTARGGGISRKIASAGDRSRLKTIAKDLDVPDGMGLIIRTAGQERNKAEIRRDYEYLLRLWNEIRELTLDSVAPCVIHEEGALVQRAIRDLYGRDVEEVLVDGEEAYRTARKIMSMLMPSRARRVKLYKDDAPLFYAYKVEDRLDAMHSPTVQLRSGGSIVIHTTEALTAIDVNSGRSTRERNIEETALKTNLEAADEVARQLRLRDLAGLVVVDFIDMNEGRNQRAVERRMRDALKSDRARVQLGRISAFGLLELSRQRLRPSFQELSSEPCPTCGGLGAIRSTESAVLQALRGIEAEGIKGTAAGLGVVLPQAVALYLLNQKRDRVVALEQRYAMLIGIRVDDDMVAGDFEIETTARKAQSDTQPGAETGDKPATRIEADTQPAEEAREGAPGRGDRAAAQDDDGRRKRRRRRRKRRGDETGEVAATEQRASSPGEDDASAEAEAPPDERTAETAPENVVPTDEAEPPRKRRRRVRKPAAEAGAVAANGGGGPTLGEVPAMEQPALPEQVLEFSLKGHPVPKPDAPRSRSPRADTAPDAGAVAPEAGEVAAAVEGAPKAAAPPSVTNGAGEDVPGEVVEGEVAEDEVAEDEAAAGEVVVAVPAGMVGGEDEPAGPPRKGWWSRFTRKEE